MIIIGYQGIGKSTLAGKNKCIDLESGNFWFYDLETYQKVRHNDWYIPYCNIANHLSEQGYIVFTSSHEVVRNELKKAVESTGGRLYIINDGNAVKEVINEIEKTETTLLDENRKTVETDQPELLYILATLFLIAAVVAMRIIK